MNKDIKFRYANETDIPLILQFIKELAQYEQMLDNEYYVAAEPPFR